MIKGNAIVKLSSLLVLSIILGLASSYLWWSRAGQTTGSGWTEREYAEVEDELGMLHSELDEVEEVFAGLVTRFTGRQSANDHVSEGDDPDLIHQIETIQRRIASLEQSLSDWVLKMGEERYLIRKEKRRQERDRAQERLTQEALAEYQESFLNPELSVGDKSQILMKLKRFPRDMKPMKPLTNEIVRLIENGEGLERVVDGIDGYHDEPRVLESLLKLLESNPTEDVKLELTRALGKSLDNPQVLAAIQKVADGPPDRAQHAASLALDRYYDD